MHKKVNPLLKGYTINRLDPTIYRVCLSPNLRYLATGDNNKQILIWEIDPSDESHFSLNEYELAKPLDLLEKGFHNGIVCGLAWSPNGRRLASSGSDNLILVWDIDFDVNTHQPPSRRLYRHTDWVTGLAWHSEERLLSGSRDNEIVCSNPETGDEVLRFANEHKPVECMTLSPCGDYLAVGSDDGIVRIYHWLSTRLICRLEGHCDCIHAIAWSSNNKIAVASSCKEIRVWGIDNDFQTVESKTLIGHERNVLSVSFSPSGQLLASQGADMTLRFWDIEHYEPIDFKEWECSAHHNTGVGFDLRTSLLVTLGKKDHAFRVWKVSVEAMLEMYKQRSPEDNREYNRLESGVIRTGEEYATPLNKLVCDAVEEAGFLPIEEGRKSVEKFYKLASEHDFLVRVYSELDELWGCGQEIKPFIKESKKCYLFVSNRIRRHTNYKDLSDAYRDLPEEQCVVEGFSGLDDLNDQIVSTLKARFAAKRQEIDTRTELQSGSRKVDFSIVAATKNELNALREAFDISPEEKIHMANRTYWYKRMPLKDGTSYYITIAQCADMANVEAALLVSDLIRTWNPQAILMVGIAAAASRAQNLGDVVLGRSVLYYERGEETSQGKLAEPITYNSDPTLLNRSSHTSKAGFKVLAKRPDSTNNPPEVYAGVIASGEKVINDQATRRNIIKQHRKIEAIEMEGYGVNAAAWQQPKPVRCLLIRGLSDYADGEKNDDWQVYAASAAASFARHFLSDIPIKPLN